MTKQQVAMLDGALLDAAVAQAEGLSWSLRADGPVLRNLCNDGAATRQIVQVTMNFEGVFAACDYAPSLWWGQAGPIIERERIHNDGDLTAAMRAYVASKFGDEVELP